MAANSDAVADPQQQSRFAIYDSDLSCSDSDSEIDPDEWVSISSSSTTTTISSLPQHLNLSLKPNPNVVKASNGPGSGRFNSQYPCTVRATSDQGRYQLQAPVGQKPAIALKRFLPELTTVYIVEPRRLPNPQWTNQSPMELFHYNQYVRICSRCAKPQMVVSCDGTWKMVSGGICDLHIGYMRTSRFVSSWISYCEFNKAKFDRSTPINSNEGETKICDQIGVLLEAVQPFERSATVNSGIQVFDMSVPSDTTRFMHQSGCQHVQ